MPLLILRCIFILATSGLGVTIVRAGAAGSSSVGLTTFFLLVFLSVGVIALDMAFPKKRIELVSSVYFGLLIGLVTTYVMQLALEPFFSDQPGEAGEQTEAFRQCVTAALLLICSYTGVSFLLQTRNDFRFIIPYVEFQRNGKGVKPLILDKSVVIDGRIADVLATKLVDGPLLRPRFGV